MAKLRHALTRRILKMFEDELRRDPETYNKWYDDFQNYFKEGLTSDSDHSEQILKVMRYKTTVSDDLISLDDYIK